MLFNSFSFLLCFLPVTLIVYFLAARRAPDLAIAWLALASLFFYGWWDVRYVPLLLASVLVNYGSSLCIRHRQGRARQLWLTAAVTFNLLLLGYYKYADFFLSSYAGLTGQPLAALHVVLPIGISFFTFTQIAFLVDTARGLVSESRFLHFLLFVTYFPHLIAGPVLHHKEMMPQFADARNGIPCAANFSVGLSIFFIGLAKKVLIADSLAPHANALFTQLDAPTFLVAWGGVLAYAFQLYFDFSGYSDMAIGLSRLFGVRLPLNFNSPYKATNIIDFWRRWHMTLSRFLRDYLYLPLGGNRRGPIRRFANLMITMLLGGLWHGAGWTFVLWGALHGVYLVINHAWLALATRIGWPLRSTWWRYSAGVLTFAAVCVAWVFFRAPDLNGALRIVSGMAGLQGVSLPDAIGVRIGALKTVLDGLSIRWELGGATRFVLTWGWVTIAAAIAFLMPNTQQIVRGFEPALDYEDEAPKTAIARAVEWRPLPSRAVVIGVLAVLGVLSLHRPSDFLYFQF
ncbi:MBOAT family protein [Pseudoduganella sp. RAF19]|uniref:MBOAT family O-acyltransferase n=2 Tax=unclassified Pseudoduganella TaxID=2637179 RepID=UPI003F966C3C